MDSPGIGESQIMDDMVNEYLPEAFAFIYVINSPNAGGIQQDRVCNIYQTLRHQTSSPALTKKALSNTFMLIDKNYHCLSVYN